jgi:hypothetical protein
VGGPVARDRRAQRHAAGVSVETHDPKQAYVDVPAGVAVAFSDR